MPTFIPGVTAQNAPRGHDSAANNTVFINSLGSVFRATWRKATKSVRIEDF